MIQQVNIHMVTSCFASERLETHISDLWLGSNDIGVCFRTKEIQEKSNNIIGTHTPFELFACAQQFNHSPQLQFNISPAECSGHIYHTYFHGLELPRCCNYPRFYIGNRYRKPVNVVRQY